MSSSESHSHLCRADWPETRVHLHHLSEGLHCWARGGEKTDSSSSYHQHLLVSYTESPDVNFKVTHGPWPEVIVLCACARPLVMHKMMFHSMDIQYTVLCACVYPHIEWVLSSNNTIWRYVTAEDSCCGTFRVTVETNFHQAQ